MMKVLHGGPGRCCLRKSVTEGCPEETRKSDGKLIPQTQRQREKRVQIRETTQPRHQIQGTEMETGEDDVRERGMSRKALAWA